MRILIRLYLGSFISNSSTETIEIKSNSIQVSELKKILEEKYKIMPSLQCLTVKMYNNTLVTMTDDWPLSFFHIKNYSVIYLAYFQVKNKNEEITNNVKINSSSKFIQSNHQKLCLTIIPESNEYNDELISKKPKQLFEIKDIIELVIDSVKKNDKRIFNALVEQYSFKNFDTLSSSGWNSLHYACHHGFTDFVCELVNKHKCDPNYLTKENWTPLHLATSKNRFDIVSILVSLDNIKVNESNISLGTPLHLACKMNYQKIISILLFKANHNVPDVHGKLPIDLTNNPDTKKLIHHLINPINHNQIQRVLTNKDWANSETNSYPFLKELSFIPPKPPKAFGLIEKIGNILPIYRFRYIEIDPIAGYLKRFKTKDDYPKNPK